MTGHFILLDFRTYGLMWLRKGSISSMLRKEYHNISSFSTFKYASKTKQNICQHIGPPHACIAHGTSSGNNSPYFGNHQECHTSKYAIMSIITNHYHSSHRILSSFRVYGTLTRTIFMFHLQNAEPTKRLALL